MSFFQEVFSHFGTMHNVNFR